MQILRKKIQYKNKNFNFNHCNFNIKRQLQLQQSAKTGCFSIVIAKTKNFATPYIYQFKNNTLIHTILVSKTVFI